MDAPEVDRLVKQLSVGFDALQGEYQTLFGQHQALERKLATAREQYNEIAKLYGTGQTATPPLSLSSAPPSKDDPSLPTSTSELLDVRPDIRSRQAASKVRAAVIAADILRTSLPAAVSASAHGVKIWSGPSADKPEGSSSLMPSISESPLEQDFTVEGRPSKLGCPFASMANKKLSSHAASVLSRYNQSNSIGAHGSIGAASTPLSTASHINGRDSFSQRRSRRTSFADPIKAEICGLSDHDSHHSVPPQDEQGPSLEKEPTEKGENADAGVCPIRFLNQHSPEEVATYFEKHKHELPRSHEVCVMRYQSNEDQIKELDAKYGNLVSMIQGLGEKHKDMLPEDPDDLLDEDAEAALDDAHVRKWASSVSAQAPEPGAEEEAEDRQPHFERPLRDIRVGESPSRPWGIQVPARYLEQAGSENSSRPARISQTAPPDVPTSKQPDTPAQETKRPAGKCPFGHGAATAPPKPTFIEPIVPEPQTATNPEAAATDQKPNTIPQMVFTGPVFIGYSAEDAARILSGLRKPQP